MKLLKLFLGIAVVAGQGGDNWQKANGRYGNGMFNVEANDSEEGRNEAPNWNSEQPRNTEQPRPNRYPNSEQPRQPNRPAEFEPEGGIREGQCTEQDLQRELQAACSKHQAGTAAAEAAQPAAYFHFSTGSAGGESRNRPVQFENADFIAGFTHRNGQFTIPYDGVYEFGVSLRLDRRRDAPLYMYVRVNNEDKLRCVALSDMSNCHGMIKAQKGDRVFVRTERNGHYGNNRDSFQYSFFEGRLVHADQSPAGAPRQGPNPEQPRGYGQNSRSTERPRNSRGGYNGRLG